MSTFEKNNAGNGHMILVVDDSRLIRTWTVDVLTAAGFQVVESEDIWIKDLIKAHAPDLILMDINLGTAKSGVIAATALKKSTAAHIPIYFYSASRNVSELEEDVRDSGADGYIPKNQDPDVLVREVRRYLGRKAERMIAVSGAKNRHVD